MWSFIVRDTLLIISNEFVKICTAVLVLSEIYSSCMSPFSRL